MLAFSTRIPLNDNLSFHDCFDVFEEWITGSPHYDIDSIDYELDSRKDFDFKKDNLSIAIRQYRDDRLKLLACRFENKDRDATFCTDCIFSDDAQGKHLLIQLNRIQLKYSSKRRFTKKPYILRHVIDYSFYRDDAGIPVVDYPLVAEDYLEVCASVMNGTHNNIMPVVYVSRDYWDSAVVDTTFLAQQLGGIAHVFVERSLDTSKFLQAKTNGNNAHFGYIGIYYPKTKHRRKFTLRDYDSNTALAWDVINAVWEAQINRLDSSSYNWNQVMSLIAGERISELQDMGEIAQHDFAALMSSHNTQVAELQEKCDTLTRQLFAVESERDLYRSRFEDCNSNHCFYKAGDEPELYPSERSDLLFSILSQVRSKYPEGSRPYVLIESMLDANPRVGTCEKMLASVTKAFSNGGKLNSAGKSMLRAHGFEITEDTEHYHLKLHDPRYMFTMSCTPGEYRSGKNFASEVRKVLNIERKL